MNLVYRITLRLSIVILLLLALWSILLFMKLTEGINDETDDALERLSELIIRKKLVGQDLSKVSTNSNSTFSIIPIYNDALGDDELIVYYDGQPAQSYWSTSSVILVKLLVHTGLLAGSYWLTSLVILINQFGDTGQPAQSYWLTSLVILVDKLGHTGQLAL